jgi:hypothetical protein
VSDPIDMLDIARKEYAGLRDAHVENARLRAEIDRLRAEIATWRDMLADCQAEGDKARAALVKYGGHDMECPDHPRAVIRSGGCVCGWSDHTAAPKGDE